MWNARGAEGKPVLITVTREIKETGYRMKTMRLTRKIYSNLSTIGEFEFDGFECWILEPTRRKNGGPVCIPPGSYKVEIRDSFKHKMKVPGLLNVPGRTDIEIHIGNYPKDTLGCLLPGKEKAVDFVGKSKEAFEELYPKVEQACKEGDVFINVIG